MIFFMITETKQSLLGVHRLSKVLEYFVVLVHSSSTFNHLFVCLPICIVCINQLMLLISLDAFFYQTLSFISTGIDWKFVLNKCQNFY